MKSLQMAAVMLLKNI